MKRTARVKRGEGDLFAEVLVMEREAGTGSRDTAMFNGHKYLRSRDWIVNAAGVRERKTTTAKTQAELERKVAKLLATPANNLEVSKMSLATYLNERYLPGAKSLVRGSTYSTYEIAVRSRIVPRIGTVKFAALTAENVRAWIRDLQSDGVGKRALQMAVEVLKRAYARASDDGVLPANPIKNVKLPQAEPQEIAFLTLLEANKLLGTTRETEWGGLLHLAVALGMRQAELFGLVWSKVHLDDANPHLDVHQQLTGKVIGPVKTKASKRKLYLDAGSIRHLERIRVEQADRPNPHDLVFPSKPKPPEPPKGEPRRVLAPAELPALQFLNRDNVTGRVLPTLQDRPRCHGRRSTDSDIRARACSLRRALQRVPSTVGWATRAARSASDTSTPTTMT